MNTAHFISPRVVKTVRWLGSDTSVTSAAGVSSLLPLPISEWAISLTLAPPM